MFLQDAGRPNPYSCSLGRTHQSKPLNKTDTRLYKRLHDLFMICQAWSWSARAPWAWPLLSTASSTWSASARPSEDVSQHTAGHTWFDQRGDMMNETLLWIYSYSNPVPVSLSRRNLAEVLMYESETGRWGGLTAGREHQTLHSPKL